MKVYWFMFLWVLILGRFQEGFSDNLIINGKHEYRARPGYAILLFAAMIFFAGMCTDCIDRHMYVVHFNNTPLGMSNFEYYLSLKEDSELFYGLQMLYKNYISRDATSWMMVIAILQGAGLIYGLRKTTPDLAMSAYIFIGSALTVSWMFNGIRQFIAVTIIFAHWCWLLDEKKWWKLLIITLFVAGITPIFSILGLGRPPWFLCGVHQSAWYFVPVIFLMRGKAWNPKMLILMLFLIGMCLLGKSFGFVETATQNTTYAVDVKYAKEGTGTNAMRVLVSFVPVVMAFLKRDIILRKNTPQYVHLFVNASLVTAGTYFISMFTSGMYVGRLPIYTELFNLMLIPWLIRHCYTDYVEEILTCGVYFGYFFYFCFQMYATWGGLYYISEPLGISLL